MMKELDSCYVVASKLGSIGMGSTAKAAAEGISKSSLNYKIFCRGYESNIKINTKNLTNYSFLEYLSYPFRFLEKKVGLKVDSFKLVNWIFGKLVKINLPKTKIYHTWMGVAPEALKKARKNRAILILEGANSHPNNTFDILEKEYIRYELQEYISDLNNLKTAAGLIKKFDYVLCPSDFVYESFLKNGFKENQLFKIPYGVDLKKFTIERKKHKKITYIFIGSIQVRKGIYYLLESWKSLNLKDAELILVGRVWPDAKNIVKKYMNEPNIKFVGFDSHPSKYLRESDVFISPSMEEGSALTCYEAMASGLPIIATFNTGAVARDKKEGFIIPAGDMDKLKSKIKYFYDNPKQIIKMGNAARKRVEDFSWENYGKKVLETYSKILKNENRNSSFYK